MSLIHPTALIEEGAVLGEDVYVGPYSTVGAQVHLKERVKLHSHVVISGDTEIGEDTEIYPFVSLGHPPQHLSQMDPTMKLRIGKKNVIRESVTMNLGTASGAGVTTVGNDGYFMANSHVAHDCVVGDHCVFANCATIGGHAQVNDHVIIGGLAAVHQHVRVGKHAIIGGMTGVEFDVIPYGSIMGNRAYLAGLNLIGLKRRGYTRSQIHDLRNAYRLLFAEEGTFQERLVDVAELFEANEEAMEIVNFVREDTARGLTMPKNNRNG